MPRHPLILDGSPMPLAGHQNCACTFYLVFKEPASALRQNGANFVVWGTLRAYRPTLRLSTTFFDASWLFGASVNRGRTAAGLTEKDQLWGAEHAKKFAPSFFRSKSSGPPGPGHAQSVHYTIRLERCQPRRVRYRRAHGRCSARRSCSNKNTRPRSAAATSCARANACSRVA